MTDGPASIDIGHIPPGSEHFGTGMVIVRMGSLVTYIDPATARAVAVYLILEAEKAGLPPQDPAPKKTHARLEVAA